MMENKENKNPFQPSRTTRGGSVEWLPWFDPEFQPKQEHDQHQQQPPIQRPDPQPQPLLSDSVTIFIKEQNNLFLDEKYLLDSCIGNMRDALADIWKYEVRTVPDSDCPMFHELAYTNFKLKLQARYVLHLLTQSVRLFDIWSDVDTTDDEGEDTEGDDEDGGQQV